jgi:hypothetical protein
VVYLAVARNAAALSAAGVLCVFGVALAKSAQSLKGARPLLSGPRGASFTIHATGVAPGDGGRGRATVTNISRRPVTVTLGQAKVHGSPFGTYLVLSIHDDTANRCYWPKSRRGPCLGYGLWSAKRLRHVSIGGRKGRTWRPRERHRFTLRWMLLRTAPNTLQRKSTGFTLRWTAR